MNHTGSPAVADQKPDVPVCLSRSEGLRTDVSQILFIPGIHHRSCSPDFEQGADQMFVGPPRTMTSPPDAGSTALDYNHQWPPTSLNRALDNYVTTQGP